jgi:hypothetical protein
MEQTKNYIDKNNITLSQVDNLTSQIIKTNIPAASASTTIITDAKLYKIKNYIKRYIRKKELEDMRLEYQHYALSVNAKAIVKADFTINDTPVIVIFPLGTSTIENDLQDSIIKLGGEI